MPSLGRLLEEMDAAVNVLQVFLIKEHDPAWVERFEELSSIEFGAIISHSNMEYQTRVATVLARHIKRNGMFTCAYCVAAVQNTSEYFRSNMVETLLPYCSDLAGNKKVIQDQLSEWEQIITSHAFQTAARRK